jgi:hypothetical protein
MEWGKGKGVRKSNGGVNMWIWPKYTICMCGNVMKIPLTMCNLILKYPNPQQCKTHDVSHPIEDHRHAKV